MFRSLIDAIKARLRGYRSAAEMHADQARSELVQHVDALRQATSSAAREDYEQIVGRLEAERRGILERIAAHPLAGIGIAVVLGVVLALAFATLARAL